MILIGITLAAVGYWIAARGTSVLVEIADHATGTEPKRWPALLWPYTLLYLGALTFAPDPKDDHL